MMYRLMTVALQTNSTQVITYRQPTQELLREAGFNFDNHVTSHYSAGPKRLGSEARDRKQAENLAFLFDLLKEAKEADGSSLFDHSLVVFGSSVRTAHMQRDLPFIVGGHGGGGMRHNQHLVCESGKTKLANLWLSILNHVGVPVTRFANSDGRIGGLFA